ncbi:hypothetical protein [Bathymodiolus septemdierum thioautotrophic gill symbiont]|uniref:FixH family protein n=1 Tax=endosymbiont of Bathymodiolus septemdierum str. Myojin knoll TaxID=1303921 RepID=A0A0P0USG7_9GAMM|nr:hypothetical protein [Bathymodiolus septemdierum thioautotrophic gill symbiont]BAS68084.1 hypothetical protein BSEPE_1095 [endosymbiont of Bathymodiolus septemdierum str. Myojin knoll]
MKHKSVIIIALAMVFTVVLSGYLIIRDRNNVDYYIQVNDCHIEKTSCQVTLDQSNTLQVNISPKGIPASERLTISVDAKGDKLDEVSVFFEAIEIDTSTPQYRLYKNGKNSFSGSGFLAICTLSKQSWIAHLIVKRGSETWEISLPFKKQLINTLIQR